MIHFFILFFKIFFRYHEAMQEEGAKRLQLLAPLFYIPAPELEPFGPEAGPRRRGEPGGMEFLFCFDIAESQGRSIEPEPPALLGPLTAAGFADSPGRQEGSMELPRGHYLFAQERELLGREAVIRAAVEMQKDGLWERLCLENRLYLRYLYEDGAAVTQLFRPYKAPADRLA
jgi:hypothetical protein